MERYKTKANIAEKQIHKLLSETTNIHRPWGLVKKNLITRTLDCTSDEVKIIYEANCNVRPGFEVSENSVYLPNLFAKFSGVDESSSFFSKISESNSRRNTYVFHNFSGFCDTRIEEFDLSSYFNESGNLNKDYILQNGFFPFSYLRLEYQKLFIEKVSDLLVNKENYIITGISQSSDKDILNMLLNIDSKLITAFNEFDFPGKPPSIIIKNTMKVKPSLRQSVSLLLLNILGFDIIILSDKGYSDIENIFEPSIYSLFYGDKIAAKRFTARGFRMLIITSAVVIISSASLLLPGLLKKDVPEPVLQDPGQISNDINDSSNQIPDVIEEPEIKNSESDTPIITKTKNADSVQAICEIRITLNDRNGNILDLSKCSYAIRAGGSYESVDRFSNLNFGNDPEDSLQVSLPYKQFNIEINKVSADINFVISNDTADYAFLIEGMVPLDDYVNYNLIEIEYNIGDLYSSDIVLTNHDSLLNPIYYSVYGQSYTIDMSPDAAVGCRGIIESQTKTIYSNMKLCDFHASGSLDDSIFLLSEPFSFKDNENLVIDFDFPGFNIYKMDINAALSDFKYFNITNDTDEYRVKNWGLLPDSSNLELYMNGDILNHRIDLSTIPRYEYEKSISEVPLKKDISIGYDTYVSNIRTYETYQGEQGLYINFTDSDFNTFYLHCYGYEDIKLDPYALKAEYYKDGNLVLTEFYNAQFDIIKTHLENGTYTVKVSPAKDNEIYNNESFFNLTVNNQLEVKYNFNLLNHD